MPPFKNSDNRGAWRESARAQIDPASEEHAPTNESLISEMDHDNFVQRQCSQILKRYYALVRQYESMPTPLEESAKKQLVWRSEKIHGDLTRIKNHAGFSEKKLFLLLGRAFREMKKLTPEQCSEFLSTTIYDKAANEDVALGLVVEEKINFLRAEILAGFPHGIFKNLLDI